MIMTNKRGEQIDSNLSDDDAVTFAGSSNSPFARDLAYKVKKRIILTPEQKFYLHKLALETKTEQLAAIDQIDSGAAAKSLELLKRFWKAGEGRQFAPALTFLLNEGVLRLTLSRTATLPNGLWISDGGGYGDSKVYGRIDQTGLLTLHRCQEWVKEALTSLIDDPDAYAIAMTELTGSCPVCGKACGEIHPVCAAMFDIGE